LTSRIACQGDGDEAMLLTSSRVGSRPVTAQCPAGTPAVRGANSSQSGTAAIRPQNASVMAIAKLGEMAVTPISRMACASRVGCRGFVVTPMAQKMK
jgi:hypothetical protein